MAVTFLMIELRLHCSQSSITEDHGRFTNHDCFVLCAVKMCSAHCTRGFFVFVLLNLFGFVLVTIPILRALHQLPSKAYSIEFFQLLFMATIDIGIFGMLILDYYSVLLYSKRLRFYKQ